MAATTTAGPVPPPCGRLALEYDPTLVEEAVLRTFAAGAPPAERAFRHERDRIYELSDREGREAAFERLHLRWFTALRLDEPIRRAIVEQPDVNLRLERGVVLRAHSRSEELADLRAPGVSGGASDRDGSGGRPELVVRLRPESFLDPSALLALLRHELQHVADMLDPHFSYRSALPSGGSDPARDHLLRERYRVVWDVTVDGRLTRRGWAHAEVRAARLREFLRAFPGLGGRMEQEFALAFPDLGGRMDQEFVRWFDAPRVTHDEIVTFVTAAARAI